MQMWRMSIAFFKGGNSVRVVDSIFHGFSDAFVSSLFSKTGLETGFSSVQERCLKMLTVVGGRGKVSLDCD